MNPAAMIVVNADTTLAASAIILKAPMVNKMSGDFYKELHNGDMAELDADNGILTRI
jgi:predicted aconitase with swiveling domain